MKKFISIIRGYHDQIFNFSKEGNYHMLPIETMKEEDYQCEIYALNSKVAIENDPHFISWTKVIYYKNIRSYLRYLYKNRNHVIYSNSITLKSLIVGMIGKYTIFCPHAYPFWHNKIKRLIIMFFYRFFGKIRINNQEELDAINAIKKNLGIKIPLSISDSFLSYNAFSRRENTIVWTGNLTPIKKPLFLISLGKRIKDQGLPLKIRIIWEDRMSFFCKKSFDDLIKENHLQDIIYLQGILSHSQIKSILSNSKYYLNTSISEGQCLAVYEAALAWCYLFLPRIIAFPSVFWENATYFTEVEELIKNITLILNSQSESMENKIEKNQKMILTNYNYSLIKRLFKDAILAMKKY